MPLLPLASLLPLLALHAPGGPGGASPAGSSPPAAEAPAGGAPGEQVSLQEFFARAKAAPPQIYLGMRSAAISAAQRVLPVVVVVPDEASYLEAIGGWAGLARYPVLWDDGTDRAREDVARFVRAFGPERVVRFRSSGAGLPTDRAAGAERLRRALSDALLPSGAEDGRDPLETFREAGLEPFGAVVVDPADPAWAGGLALAAGRFQALLVVEAPSGRASGEMGAEDLAALARGIREGLEAAGLSWRDLKDLDAVTLALNAPVKVRHQAGQDKGGAYALTDLIGRADDGAIIGGGARWAWCGQLLGDGPASVYRAMCSLFLAPDRAWVFDTYDDAKEPWSAWSGAQAAEGLRKRGVQTVVFSGERRTLHDWRMGAGRGVNAGLVLVNSAGNANSFNLPQGPGTPADTPALLTPAIVHYVHSFSAERGDDRRYLAGRWLEHGAYAYFGSVNEPYLQAFVPTPLLVERLWSGLPLGAATRLDEPPVRPWKLTLLGDPLITIVPPGQRLEDEPLPLAGAEDLGETVRASLQEQRFADAARALVLSGRDADAARLGAALLKDRPAAIDGDLASTLVPALYRARDYETMLAMFRLVPEGHAALPALRDLLWHGARVHLSVTPGQAAEDLLGRNLRPGSELGDLKELAEHVNRRAGPGAAAAVMRAHADRVPARSQDALEEAIQRYVRAIR